MKYLIGVQPTGKLHIGNYLGCLRKGIQYQNEGHDVTFMIANYHSLTTDSYTDVTRRELEKLGCAHIIEQTPEYTELFFKLCCKVSLPTLLKMPQYKDKKDEVKYDMGLLLYPVLMCADVIINDPDVVLIGKDQVAHLDLCNDLAKRIGGREYKYELGDVERVMSLVDPSKKMSKSLGDKHVLYLFDEDFNKKLAKATSTPEGLKNLELIGKSFGLRINDYDGNAAYKKALANKLYEEFDSTMIVNYYGGRVAE